MDAEATLRELLEKIAAERSYHHHEITIKPITSAGANYSSTIFLATIAAPGQPDIKTFAKVATFSDELREKTNAGRLFYIERSTYGVLLQAYKSIQDKFDIPDSDRFIFPMCYGCSAGRGNETVVLEDLTAKGFTSFDRFESVSWQYAAAAVTALARWHALSFIYRQENPEEYDKFAKTMVMDFPDSGGNIFENMAKGAIAVVQDKYKTKLAEFVEQKVTSDEFHKYYRPRKGMTKVLGHGDFKPSNLMFKTLDETIQIIPVDYQVISETSPVSDLLYFIFTGSDREFRKQHHTQLIDHYHRQLTAELERFHLDVEQVYPRATFDSELKDSLPFGLLVGIIILPILMVEPSLAPVLSEGLGLLEAEVAPSELYAQRLNELVEDFVEWGVLVVKTVNKTHLNMTVYHLRCWKYTILILT